MSAGSIKMGWILLQLSVKWRRAKKSRRRSKKKLIVLAKDP